MLTCGTIIVIGWQMGMQGVPSDMLQAGSAAPTSIPTAVTTPQPVVTSSTTPTAITPTQKTTPSVASSTATLKVETVQGDTVSTRYGDVQVSVTFNGKTITDVTALHLTDEDRRSVSISNNAEPKLKSSVLKSQSANVSAVSGATYTSEGYLQSVQSAIDKHNA